MMTSRIGWIATAGLVFAFASTQAMAVPTPLIGDGLNNGYFSDLSNPSAETAGGNPLTVTLGTNRAFLGSSATGANLTIPNWVATRIAYPGGNDAFGYDGAGGNGPNGTRSVGFAPYAFINSGTVDFTSDAVAGPFGAGSEFQLDFGAFQVNPGAGTFTATLDFDTGETHTFASIVTPSQDGSVFLNTVDNSYTLLADAASVSVTIRVESNGSQVTFDNVDLIAEIIPEPASLALLGLGGLALLARRRPQV